MAASELHDPCAIAHRIVANFDLCLGADAAPILDVHLDRARLADESFARSGGAGSAGSQALKLKSSAIGSRYDVIDSDQGLRRAAAMAAAARDVDVIVGQFRCVWSCGFPGEPGCG
jgi:hypothetical protein